MGELDDSISKDPIECPVCHNTEVSRISEPGYSHQCKTCSHRFLSPGTPTHEQRDYDFPSPEDHELD